MKILLASGVGFKTHTVPELETAVRSWGYNGLELNMPPRHLPPEESVRDTTYEGLSAVPVVHAPGDVYDEQRFIAALDDACTVAQHIRAHKVVMHPAALRQGGRAVIERTIQYVKTKEEQTGVLIAYEVLVNPQGLALSRQAWFAEQQAYFDPKEWLDDVQKYQLHACLDTTHIASWGEDPTRYLDLLGPRLVHVHISDYDSAKGEEHLSLGSGAVDLSPFISRLQQTHPDITVTVEVQPQPTIETVEVVARQNLAYINRALSG